MNAFVITMFKGQRMDLTVQMKDADLVLGIFKAHSIRFDKKYTTITGDGPSTITFKNVRPEAVQGELADLISDLTIRARDGEIGNVYAKFVGPRFAKPHAPEQKKPEAEDIPEVANDDTL